MKTIKLFLTFALIGVFQLAYAQTDIIVSGQLLNVSTAPFNVVTLNFYDGTFATSSSANTDINGYYSHTFPGTLTSAGTVELIVHDCNNDTIFETKAYNVSTGDTLVNFTTFDYCPTTNPPATSNVYASGNLTNTNSVAISVLLSLVDVNGNTMNATAITNTNGDYAQTFSTTTTSQGTVYMQVLDCNADSIYETKAYDLNVNDSLVTFTTADYCPAITPPVMAIYASGQLTNTASAGINVSLELMDGGNTTSVTVVTDANGDYSHIFYPSTTQGTVYMQVQDCNADSIFETKPFDYTTNDTLVNFTTFDYCPVTVPTTCQAYFTVAQATGPNGGTIAGSVQVTDGSTASNPANLTYTWYFGDGSPNGVGTALTHNYPLNGPYALCLTINDGLGCISSHCDTISVDASGLLESEGFTLYIGTEVLAVEKTNFSSAVSIYPNPASDFIHIEYNTGNKALNSVTMYDLTGKVVFENNSNNGSAHKMTINTENIETGTYLIKMLFDDEIYNQKIIIK
ncbi:hypothetical protein DNU06_03170 [Putridiphycobacter roseus]|uniref:PKD domain-containing protein n=1 Tax=Putridiphycobacter roseus TaxID=2219161 RepID=A0A2W1NLX1_9FLAO|nr:T9SS type A sorting domain-containing protein [Putridiphycobacter roseus]PZE18846.1 hypothetical protein DNU06_03170 [Putridiphycobacter roseus]